MGLVLEGRGRPLPACGLSLATRYLPPATSHQRLSTCHTPPATWCIPPAILHPAHLTCYLAHPTCYLAHPTCHQPHPTCHQPHPTSHPSPGEPHLPTAIPPPPSARLLGGNWRYMSGCGVYVVDGDIGPVLVRGCRPERVIRYGRHFARDGLLRPPLGLPAPLQLPPTCSSHDQRERNKGPCDSRGLCSMVGDTGIEPVTSFVSGKRATTAPIARMWSRSSLCARDLHREKRGGYGIRTRVHGFAGRCLASRPTHRGSGDRCERTTGLEPATLTLAR